MKQKPINESLEALQNHGMRIPGLYDLIGTIGTVGEPAAVQLFACNKSSWVKEQQGTSISSELMMEEIISILFCKQRVVKCPVGLDNSKIN